MIPVDFDITNAKFTAPMGYDESQVFTIPAYVGEVPGPNAVEGTPFVVVAWKPTEEDIELIRQGSLVYISQLGGLSPHFLTTKIEEACYQPT